MFCSGEGLGGWLQHIVTDLTANRGEFARLVLLRLAVNTFKGRDMLDERHCSLIARGVKECR